MCGRYGQTELMTASLFQDLQLEFDPTLFPGDNYNTSHSNATALISYDQDGKIGQDVAYFAYIPYYACKKDEHGELIDKGNGWPLITNHKFVNINARAEGKEGKDKLNADNDPEYSGKYHLFTNSGFKVDALKHRCIIPVDYFIEGPAKERLSKPYVIRRKDNKPIGLAGFYSEIFNRKHMAIVTVPPNNLLWEEVGHHRSPLVLNYDQMGEWLDPESDIAALENLIDRFDPEGFEAFAVTPNIKTPNRGDKPNNSPELIQPIPKTLFD